MHSATSIIVVWGAFLLTALSGLGVLAVVSHRINKKETNTQGEQQMKKYEVTLSFVVEVEAPDAEHAYNLACGEVDDLLEDEMFYASDLRNSIKELENN